MMRFLLDTNVVLDVLLDRQPFVSEAREVWQAAAPIRVYAPAELTALLRRLTKE